MVDMQAAIEKTAEPWLVKRYKLQAAAEQPAKRPRSKPTKDALGRSLVEMILRHRKAFLAAASWSPPTSRGLLLAVLDSVAGLRVLAPSDSEPEMGSSDLEDSALVDLTRDFQQATGDKYRASLDVCFWPSPLMVLEGGRQEAAALLCACRGSSAVIWQVGPSFGCPQRLALVRLEPSLEITAVAASSSWKASDGSLVSVLALATSSGQVHARKVSVDSNGCMSTSVLGSAAVFEVGNCVGQLALLTNISEDVEVVLAVGHGVRVSAAVLSCSKEGSLKSVTTYAARSACHALPIVSVLCVASGIVTPSFSSGNADVLSMDTSGHGVLWQFSHREDGQLCPGRLCSFVPGSWQSWLTAVEQRALRLDARMVRTGAREREARRGGSIFSGLALSPSHCMLALQSMTTERATAQRVMSSLLVTPVGSPMHAFNALLQHLVQAAQRSQVSFFYCSLWDVAQAWQIQTQHKCSDIDLKSPEGQTSAFSHSSCELLELCLGWVWTLADVFTRVAQAAKADADEITSGLLGRTSISQLQKLALEGFVPQTLAERRALASEGQQQLLDRLLGHLAGTVCCQVQNACIELARLAIGSQGRCEKEYRQADLPADWEGSLLAAATQEYWRLRLTKTQTPLGPSTNLLAFLSHPKKAPEQKCRLCQKAGQVHPSLLEVSCGVHALPLCQESLRPLLSEPSSLCGFCGRRTELTAASALRRLCAWCAAPASKRVLLVRECLPLPCCPGIEKTAGRRFWSEERGFNYVCSQLRLINITAQRLRLSNFYSTCCVFVVLCSKPALHWGTRF